MKKSLAIPALAAGSSLLAFVLRLLQNHSGFEPGTGLPVSGHFAGTALVVLLAGTVLLLALLSLRLPKDPEPLDFLHAFSTSNPVMLMLPVAGILLMGLSGVVDIAVGLGLYDRFATAVITADGTYLSAIPAATEGFPPSTHLLLGIFSLCAAATLFPVTASCRHKEDATLPNGTLLLITPAVLVVRLVLTYRVYSVNPVLMAYYVELLALVLLTLGFYRLSSFPHHAGKSSLFIVYAAAALPFCAASLAGSSHPATSLLYLGGGLLLFGFLLLRLASSRQGSS